MPRFLCRLAAFALFLSLPSLAGAAPVLKALIIDGQNNHNWKATTPILKETLEKSGIFTVDVATTPAKGTEDFRPKFADYAVVVSNYNGQAWPRETREDFVTFVKNGGGLVIVHAADNSFPNWPEYNEMIGLGGFILLTPMTEWFIAEQIVSCVFVCLGVVLGAFACHAPAPSAWADAAQAPCPRCAA